MIAEGSRWRGGSGASREHCDCPRSEGDIGGESGGAVNLVPCAPAPTSLYIAGHRGPPTIRGLGAPDQGAGQGARRAVGLDRYEINLTASALMQSTRRLNKSSCKGQTFSICNYLCDYPFQISTAGQENHPTLTVIRILLQVVSVLSQHCPFQPAKSMQVSILL